MISTEADVLSDMVERGSRDASHDNLKVSSEDTDEVSISASVDAGLIVPNISNGKNDVTDDTCTTEDDTTPCTESYSKIEETTDRRPEENMMEENNVTTSATTITDTAGSGLNGTQLPRPVTADRTDEADIGGVLEDASSVKDSVRKFYGVGASRDPLPARGDMKCLFFWSKYKFWLNKNNFLVKNRNFPRLTSATYYFQL